MKKQFPGKWAITFKFSGTCGRLFAFYTDFPKSNLTLVSDPSEGNAGEPNPVWIPVPKIVKMLYILKH